MSPENIIYIIAVIAWVLYSAFKGNKKQTKKPPTNTQEPKDFKTLMEEILTGKPTTQQQPIPQPNEYRNKIKNRKKQKKEITFIQESSKTESSEAIETRNYFLSLQTQEQDEKMRKEKEQVLSESEDILSDMDARKLILYSEIMKRPNY